jgi:malate dehydrogenase (oxaloacetate-decarboxylating)(NADP+)
VRSDAIIATGRSDYPEPGQQRPLLPLHLPRRPRCRGDDDHRRNEDGRVRAIAELARAEQSEVAARAYGEKVANFGPEYLIPNPSIRA